METHLKGSLSLWNDGFEPDVRPPLRADLDCDVCVVGAGIAGLTTAYCLLKEGRSVSLIEARDVAAGQSGRTTAHISNALDDRYFNIERYHGHVGAQMAAASHTAAIEWIENTVRLESIDCAFSRLPGYLFLGPSHSTDYLQKEYEAGQRAGLTEIRPLREAPLNLGPCLEFPRQAQFHATKYLQGLARAVERLGGHIYPHTRMLSLENNENNVVLKTEAGHSIIANAVVVATNSPVNDRVVMHTKQAAYRSYVIAARIPKNSVPKALYWDTLDPYHYIRVEDSNPNHDVLIVGGADHKTGQNSENPEAFLDLEAWTRAHFPMTESVSHQWSGQVLEPVDAMGFIGRDPIDSDKVFIVTGDSGNGITHGTLAGPLICDLIMGRENIWEDLYDPARKTLRSANEFVRENANVALQYTDWLKKGDVASVQEVARGSGAVLREGLHLVACYRDELGELHRCSAVCPHLEGIVHWNPVESTWDCPCHGSRFDAKGQVLSGPAISNLKTLQSRPGDAPSSRRLDPSQENGSERISPSHPRNPRA
jgi:glycine/D-amino acid oxidase-like deaminating enzyme/nitrite reductase/ring-hydroxylating ferredoxin subunit